MSQARRTGDEFDLRERMPVGSNAIVFLPAQREAGLTESGKPHEQALGNFDPGQASYLSLRFRAGSYEVYAVTR